MSIYIYPEKSFPSRAIDFVARPVQILLNCPTKNFLHSKTTRPPLALRVGTLALMILSAYIAPFFAAIVFGTGVLALLVKPFFIEHDKINLNYLWMNLEADPKTNDTILRSQKEEQRLETFSILLLNEFKNGFTNFQLRIPLYVNLLKGTFPKVNQLIPLLYLSENDTPDVMLSKYTFYRALFQNFNISKEPYKAPKDFYLSIHLSSMNRWMDEMNRCREATETKNLNSLIELFDSMHSIGSLRSKSAETVDDIMIEVQTIEPANVLDLRTIWVANRWLSCPP